MYPTKPPQVLHSLLLWIGVTAVSVAALTVYDMAKAVDRGMTIESIRLERKSGGKSGEFVRETP